MTAHCRWTQLHALRVERRVDQGVIRAVYFAVAVEVAIKPAADVALRRLVVEGAIDAGVIGAVDFPVEVSVAVVGVFDEDGGVVDSLSGKEG